MRWLIGLTALTCMISVVIGSQPRVAIIGGGASGLTSAYVLNQQGYVPTLFEKGSKVGGVAVTHTLKGKAYDMATMYVPGGSITGQGFEPTLKGMIDIAGEELYPAIEFDTYDLPSKTLNPIPENLRGASVDELKSQILAGLAQSTKLAVCLSQGINCQTCGVCAFPREPLMQWGNRVGLPLYAGLIAYVFDGLGASPAVFISPVDAILGQFAVVDAAYLLRRLNTTLPENTSPNIVSLMNSQRWYTFRRGYQTFFRTLANKLNINLRHRSTITGLSYADSKWTIEVNGRPFHRKFDKVLVTAKPEDAVQFVPAEYIPTLQLGLCRAPLKDTMIVRLANYSVLNIPQESGWWSVNQGLGTANLMNPAVGGVVKPFFWVQRHANLNYMMIGTVVLNPALTKDQVYQSVVEYADSAMGLKITKLMHYERYCFPNGPSNSTAWNEQWATLQGKDGLFFAGETFFGAGVPTITARAKQILPNYFPKLN